MLKRCRGQVTDVKTDLDRRRNGSTDTEQNEDSNLESNSCLPNAGSSCHTAFPKPKGNLTSCASLAVLFTVGFYQDCTSVSVTAVKSRRGEVGGGASHDYITGQAGRMHFMLTNSHQLCEKLGWR